VSELPGYLRGLNHAQYAAVTTLEGPLLILAGAGSGKTRVLTRRVAHLIHSGVAPENLLAVTFTNKAAHEMKERVVELIGEVGERVWVSTFHSTCARLLRVDIEPLGWTRRFAIYDDDDQLRMMKEIVGQLGYDPAQVAPKDLLGQIDGYKNRMLTADDLVRTRRAHVNDLLVRVWREYDEALRAADAVDFNDLIGLTVRLLREHPAVLQKWRDRFRYLMVDEYQDTNKGQYDLLRLLADGHRNLGVVGDDDQSIYGFRGADVSNILNFQQDFPGATVVRLEQNYRSTSNILCLANAVVKQNPNRLDKELWTEAPGGPKISLHAAETPGAEAQWVARAILQLRRFGHEYGEIALIYRTNALARLYESALRDVHIPYKIVGGRKFYERREVRDILAYLRLVVNPADDAAFLRVVNVPPRGVGTKTLQALRDDAGQRGVPLLGVARGRAAGQKGLKAFVDLIDALNHAARDEDPPELLARVVALSGYRGMLEEDKDARGQVTREAAERLEHLDELVAEARSHTPAPEQVSPMERLTGWLDRVSLTADADTPVAGGEVTLMTVHSSKGLEFPVVFVVQMSEGIFPHARAEGETGGVEEERRLAYVAFTRAMKRLIVSRSRQLPSWGGRDGGGAVAVPSRFLFGIPTEVCEGDLPAAEPASALPEPPDVHRAKLSAFVQRRTGTRDAPDDGEVPAWLRPRARAAAPPPEAPVDDGRRRTLVEIHALSQLARGVRVHHPRHGDGAVRRVQATQVLVDLDAGGQRWIPLGSGELSLLVGEEDD